MRRLKRSADCARNSQPEYDHSGVPDTVPLSTDDRALLSGLRRNAGGKSAPCRTSGTEFSVSSAGPLYGGDVCFLFRLLVTLFPDREGKIPHGTG